MVKPSIVLFVSLLVLITANPHYPNPPPIPTLVTAWFPSSDKQKLPTGQESTVFSQLLQTQMNLIVFGNKDLGAFVGKTRDNKNTKFVQLDETVLLQSWYMKTAKKLALQSKQDITDKVSPTLAYSRMVLLNKAVEQDPFNSDEFIWVNPNGLANSQVSNIVQPRNVDSLLLAFRHHFFFLSTPKNAVHAYPNIEKTYFQAKFETFVGGELFGGKKEAISTIYYIYQDLLRVVVEYDHNLWTEDALLSMLADRCPFLISYLTADESTTSKPSKPAKRLLPEDTEKRFQDQKEQLQNYQKLIGMSEFGILFVGILICWEVLKFLKFAKRQNGNFESESEGLRLSPSNAQ